MNDGHTSVVWVQTSAIHSANELLTLNNTIVKTCGECTIFISTVIQKTNKMTLQINQSHINESNKIVYMEDWE